MNIAKNEKASPYQANEIDDKKIADDKSQNSFLFLGFIGF